MTRKTLEWAPFRLRPGIAEERLLDASAKLQADFVSKQAGFLGRRLVRKSDGSYIDLVLWESMAAADKAMQHAAESDTCSTFFTLMESEDATAGAGVEHFEVVAEY